MSTRTDKKWRHYRCKLMKAELQIELADLAEFLRFADDHVVGTIYCFEDQNTITHFGMSHKGGLLTVDAQGYRELGDYRASVSMGFGDSATYYDATARGFESLESYNLSRASDLNDPETYRAMVAEHYEDGYPDYVKLKEAGRLPNGLPDIANPYDLYRFGKEAGFKDWFDMLVALEKGFLNAADHRSASEMGYTSVADFETGRKAGFASAKEWEDAKKARCVSRDDFRAKLDLELIDAPRLKHDCRVLVRLFSRIPEKTDVSVGTIQKLLDKELEPYRDPESNKLRPWFTTQLQDFGKLLAFLRKNESIKRFGTYHHDREVFTTGSVQERQVVLDGSNVAYNSQGNALSTPKLENLKRMMAELRKRGFKDLKVIVDASLRYRIDDPKGLDAFAETEDYFEVPKGNSADPFVIAHVKKHNCLMVSNDQFREWKINDPWIKDNIDYYRLTFKITDKKVILPEFDSDGK